MTTRRAAGGWLTMGIALLCFATAGGSMTTTDAVVAFDVTRNLVEHRSVATTGDLLGNGAYRGRNGSYYSPFGIAQSVWNIPFYLGGRAVTARVGPRIGGPDTLVKAAVALATVPAVALLGWACFSLLLELGAAPDRAAATVLLLVVATPLWPYSGFGFNQPLAGMFLWFSVLGAVAGVRGRRRALVLSGVSAGLALLTRHEMILPAAVLGGWIALRSGPGGWAAARSYLSGLVPPLAVWLALNWWRFGNPLETGYMRDPTPGFGGDIIGGAAGLLFSPYASIFLYCPIAILSVAAARAMWRRDRAAAALLAMIFCVGFAVYASLENWMGGRSYGPRYLVPLLPALVLPLAFWSPSRGVRPLAASLIALSVAVQLPGVLVDYSKVRQERAEAGDTVAQDMRWAGMPLLLNTEALLKIVPRTAQHLAGTLPRPPIRQDDPALSRALSAGLDLWWMHLFYLGVIGGATAAGIGACLTLAAALAIVRALWLAGRLQGAS
jgi:hypothetical protein